MKTFETFTKDGKRFLAFENGAGSVQVISEDGENYGSWNDAGHFRDHYPKGRTYSATVLGRAGLRVAVLS